MNPKPINDSEVRITDIKVRSALMRVRWNDMPVRRAESSVFISAEDDFEVTASMMASSLLVPGYCAAGDERQRRAIRATGPRMIK